LLVLVLVIVGGAAYALVAQPWKSNDTLRDTASTGTTAPNSPAASGTAAASGSAARSPAGSAGDSPSSSATAHGTGSASAGAVTEEQAATSLATMLSQSVSDRTAISNAYNDVDACGPNLTADGKAFTDAASSRRTLLSSLGTMPGRATLPASVLADLTNAWQASIAADQAYATWTNDEIAQGCVPGDTSDPGYVAAQNPNTEATADKQAFSSGWNPIAARYGLTQYQPDQL
jgi:hypothetical protein